MKVFLILLLVILPPAAYSATNCRAIFVTKAEHLDFMRGNDTAKLSFASYLQPNSRNLAQYSAILGAPLNKIVGKTSTVLDLGGGKGKAMYELAEQTGAHTIVINTQEMESLPPVSAGTFEYRKGWAEELIREYPNAVDLVTDVWGAFSYSIAKVEILEEIWKSLKPGGVAYILYHPFKTPAIVQTKNGRIDLDIWLQEKYPEIVSSESSSGDSTFAAKIIKIKKSQAGGNFIIPLKLDSHEYITSKNNLLPHVSYIELD